MKISKQDLHILLGHFEEEDASISKSNIRLSIEALREDLSKHAAEGYKRMYAVLDETEMAQLISAIRMHINEATISDMSCINNRMLNKLMCTSLLHYELDERQVDEYKTTVDQYFFALNKELNLLNPSICPAEEINSLNIWLEHVVEIPPLYLNHLLIGGNGNTYYFNLLGLEECGCVDLSHDRLLSDVRLQVEKLVLNQCQNIHAANHGSPVKILSLGPGKALQDFIIIFKLFSMGIRNIELTLVESEYKMMLDPKEETVKIWQKDWQKNDKLPDKYYRSNQDKIYSIIRALSLLTRKFSDANLIVHQYPSVDSMKRDISRSGPFDITYAIDLDDYQETGGSTYNDFHSLGDCLAKDGLLILSYHYLIKQFMIEQQQDEPVLREISTRKFTAPEIIDGQGYAYKNNITTFFKVERNTDTEASTESEDAFSRSSSNTTTKRLAS